MVNILHFETEDGEAVSINAAEIQGEKGKAYLKQLLKSKKDVRESVDTCLTDSSSECVTSNSEAIQTKE